MARVPYLERESLDAEGQQVYDRIRQERNSPTVGLQFRALLHSPRAAGYLASMGAEMRFRNSLPEDIKELAAILVAREWNSDIEWTAHTPQAAKAGISAASIEAVRTRKAPAGLTEREQIIVRFVQQLLRDKKVSDETFSAVQKLLGTRGVVDLTLTCSYYTALALTHIALKSEMEPGMASTL